MAISMAFSNSASGNLCVIRPLMSRAFLVSISSASGHFNWLRLTQKNVASSTALNLISLNLADHVFFPKLYQLRHVFIPTRFNYNTTGLHIHTSLALNLLSKHNHSGRLQIEFLLLVTSINFCNCQSSLLEQFFYLCKRKEAHFVQN